MENKKILLEKLLKTNLLPLAFLGDSIHTLFIRENSLLKDDAKMSSFNSFASSKCKAQNQANTLKQILDKLNEDEYEIVRRARNAKSKHHAKNSTSADYSFATAYEALIGYLYLKEDISRLTEFLNSSLK